MTGFKMITLGVIAALALAGPAVAQEKTKQKSGAANDEGLQILADARYYCDGIAGNQTEILEELEQAGWDPEVDAYGEVPFYHEIEGGLDYPGAGRAEIWGFVELYPDHIIGYCTFEIVDSKIDIPVESLLDEPGLAGHSETIDAGTYTTLSNTDGETHLFIQARQTTDSFIYQVTDLIEDSRL